MSIIDKLIFDDQYREVIKEIVKHSVITTEEAIEYVDHAIELFQWIDSESSKIYIKTVMELRDKGFSKKAVEDFFNNKQSCQDQ